MRIEYLGHSSFLITTNEGVRIVTDPYRGVGYDMPKNIQADIVTVSHGHFDHNNAAAVNGSYVLLDRVGERTACGIDFYGTHTFHDHKEGRLRGENVVFSFEADGVKVCHLGDIGEELREDLIEKIGRSDVLLIPIGGKYTIDARQAKEYIERIKPKVAIPMHYKPQDGSLDISAANVFLNLFEGIQYAKTNGDIRLKDSEKGEKTQIVFLERGETVWIKM